jgi:peptidoglycan/LPS O-acetylase OafA/YrhL
MKNKEIQGLRAIAVIGVVLYHANFQWIPGGFLGVDVFFVISGYLISQMIVKELSATGKVDLPNFYARRLRRLLPTAILVIIATLSVGRHLISPIRHKTIAIDAISSIFYGANYRFYFSQIDYLNIGAKPSLFLHFWSLAVEEQFYLFWPLLLLIGWKFFKRFGVFIILVATAAFSFYYSLLFTKSNPTFAFYSLPTRAWEFALGAITFLLISKLNGFWKLFRFIFGWAGLAGLIYSFITITDTQEFPGMISLIPTIATALVIAASSKGKFFGSFLLTNPLFYGIGAISYSLYLWHWPVYQLMSEVIGTEFNQINLVIYAVILIVITVATYFVIEKPIRSYQRLGRKPSYGFIWGGITSLIATFVAISIMGITLPIISSPIAQGQNIVGIAQPTPTPTLSSNSTPSPEIQLNLPVRTTTPITLSVLKETSLDVQCQSKNTGTDFKRNCNYGDLNAAQNIIIFGDSHANQWVPALNLIGKKNNYKITVFTKSGCPAADLEVLYEVGQKFVKYPECDIWRKNVIKEINTMRTPDLIILASNKTYNAGKDTKKTSEYWISGYSSTLSNLQRYTDRVVIMNDTPRPGTPSPIDCLGKNLNNPSYCDMNYLNVVATNDRKSLLNQIGLKYSIPIVDPIPWLCENSNCPSVLDGIPVYADATHISARISENLAPLLEQAILKKLNS